MDSRDYQRDRDHRGGDYNRRESGGGYQKHSHYNDNRSHNHRNYSSPYHRRDNNNHHNHNNSNYRGGNRRWSEPTHHRKREVIAPKVFLTEREEILKRMNSLIVRLGDKSTSGLEENLKGLLNALESELENSSEDFIETILQCVQLLPHKSGVYALLSSLLSIKKSSFFVRLLTKTSQELFQTLEKFEYLNAKNILKFVTLLTNAGAVTSSSLVTLLTNILQSTLESSHQQVLSSRKDIFVFLILNSFHWFSKPKLVGFEMKELWEGLKEYFEKRIEEPKTVLEALKGSSKQDYLLQLWKEIESRGGEERESLDEFDRLHIKFETLLSDILPESFPLTLFNPDSIPYPPNSLKSILFPFPRAPFQLFDNYLDEEEEKLPFLNRFHFESIFVDVLQHFESSPKDAVKVLLSLPNDVLHLRLLAETIFSQLFLLPKTPIVEIYYGVVIQELCKSNPSFPPILAQATDATFERIEELDLECFDRFTSWLSHHLSNFDYKWIWTSWDFVLDDMKEEGESLKTKFIRESIEKMIRLSYRDRVKKSLPDEFQVFLPSTSSNPQLRFEEGEKSEEASILLERIRSKDDSEDLKTLLSTEQFAKYSEGERLQLLIQSIFKFGSKSFSHIIASFDRYSTLLSSFVTTKEDQIVLLDEASFLWENSDFNLFILIERLLSFKLVDGPSLADWIFSKPTLFTKVTTWEILRSAIEKSVFVAQSLRKEIQSLVGEDEKSTEERNKLQNNLEEMNRDQREMFIVIFQRFNITLRDHITQSEPGKESTFWFKCTLGHYTEIARRYYEHFSLFLPMLETILLSEHVDERVRGVFLQLKNI